MMLIFYFKQAWRELRQNPFYAAISILTTAVTLAFAMVAYIVYDLGSADMPPETRRSQTVYSANAYSWHTATNSNRWGGMSRQTVRFLTDSLANAETVALMQRSTPLSCETPDDAGFKGRLRVRSVDANWWKIFDYRFIDGRPFAASDGARNLAVITESVARQMFGDSHVVGRELKINSQLYTICGVSADVSPLFAEAWGEVWNNVNYQPPYTFEEANGSERVAGDFRFAIVAKSGKRRALQRELAARIERFNESLQETTFNLDVVTSMEQTFNENDFGMSATLLYALLIAILLVVPAMNISGLVSSMLEKRYAEIGIRKVYGASRGRIVRQFLTENLLLVMLGGVIGFGLSIAAVGLFRTWLMAGSDAWQMAFRPSVFFAALGICLVFNAASTLLPVWYCTRKAIVETLKG